MAEIATTRQLHPLVRQEAPPTAPQVPATRKGFSRRSFFSLAAAGLAVAGAGGIAIDQYRDNSRTRQENEQLAALLAEPDAQTVRGDIRGGGQAAVVMSPSKDRAIVLLHGLPKLPDDKTYQLWLMDKSRTMHSAGLASGAVAGDQSKLIQGGIADKIALGLTIEDKPGATQPTLSTATLINMA
ncbi:hypothetical protein GCM10009789_21060 [Kribbella sancticallisti]|uniref:Anti-sigma K factor RskA C-terminal domain-containing protein n=2 Tax=Kribbella sancticallisti TaxID=460087 RepID=A0ABP4NV82_9ACTN